MLKGWNECVISEPVYDRSNMYASLDSLTRQKLKDKGVPFYGAFALDWDFSRYDYKLEEGLSNNTLKCYWRNKVA